MLFFLPAANTKKVGFTATKKIGNAVQRNRAKRILREASHILLQNYMLDYDIALIANQSTPKSNTQKVADQLQNLKLN